MSQVLRLFSIAVFSSCLTAIFSSQLAARGQVTPDTTLGEETSQVLPLNLSGSDGNIIFGGATRGANLFHSFSTFNIAEGEFAFFANPATIERIFSRVTGDSPSTILGTLSVLGEADLFFLNPNGILFGPNSSTVLIGGSLVATTADGFVFDNNQFFNARNPASAPLLAVNVPTGIQYGNQKPGDIRNQGLLGVDQGNSLLLLGGNVFLEGTDIGSLPGTGSRLQISAINDSGMVDFITNNDLINLDIENNLERADIFIQNSQIDVRANELSGIWMTARNINISNSFILAGIAPNLGFVGAQAADIVLDATNEIHLFSSSGIGNLVSLNAVGDTGDIRIQTPSLIIANGSELSTSTFGLGNAGDIFINADEIAIAGGNSRSSIRSVVEATGRGLGGSIQIEGNSLDLRNGAQIASSTLGRGHAGNISVEIDGSVVLDGTTAGGQSVSGLFSTTETDFSGNGGNVNLSAGSLSITDGAVINASTAGAGNAGNIVIKVDDFVRLNGTTPNTQISSGLFSTIELNARGNSGNIELSAGSLSVTNGAVINVSNRGGEGNAGNIIITVDDFVRLSSTAADGRFISGLASAVSSNAEGNGGNIELRAGSLSISNGAAISASTSGNGNAGNIVVTVDGSVSLDGTTTRGEFRSGLFSVVDLNAQGDGGNVKLKADTLSITNGAAINTGTFGNGDAGNIVVAIADSAVLDGIAVNGLFSSGLGSDVGFAAQGDGGNVNLTANSLTVRNGALISAISFGQGNAGNIALNLEDSINLNQGFIASNSFSFLAERGGNISIDAGSLTLENGSGILTETLNSQGGNVSINLDDLLIMRNGSLISTTAGTAQAGGNGGNIDITADFIIGVRDEDSDIAADAFTGNGGQVTISALDIFGLEFRDQRTPLSDITASSEQGAAGIITFNRLTPIDVRQGLTELPENIVDPTGLIDRRCDASSRQAGEFIITGRGGLPPKPDERFDNSQFLDDLGPSMIQSDSLPTEAESETESQDRDNSSSGIQEAQGWIVNDVGQLQLITAVPRDLPLEASTIPTCNDFRQPSANRGMI